MHKNNEQFCHLKTHKNCYNKFSHGLVFVIQNMIRSHIYILLIFSKCPNVIQNIKLNNSALFGGFFRLRLFFYFEKVDIRFKLIILWTGTDTRYSLHLFELTERAVHLLLFCQSPVLPVAEQQLCYEVDQINRDTQKVMGHKLHPVLPFLA